MRGLAFIAGASLLAMSNTAFAQESATRTDPPAAKPSDQTTDQGEIIVTARRRTETAQQTPVPLTVLNEALLDRYGVKGIDSIASLTPGFFTGETSGAVGGSISLRGVGSGESAPFIDQAVSVNVDGVQISTAQILRAAQMDLKQIEVLRGPQALFFGKNSPGGVISLTTADPGSQPEAMLRGGYEFKANEWYWDATASVPVSDDVGVRLAAHYSTMDGYIKVISPPTVGVIPSDLKAFPKKNEAFLRGTISLKPSDQLSIRLKGTYTDTNIVGGASYFSDIVHCPYGVPQEIIVVPSNCQNDGVIVAAQIPLSTLALNPLLERNGHRHNEQVLLTGTVDYQLTDALKLTSVSGYYNVDENSSSNGGYGLAASNVFTVLYKNKQFSEELRLASQFKGPLNFLLGGHYEDRKLFTQTYIVIPTSGNFELPVESTHQKQLSYSVFGQLLFDVTNKVQITAGGRYSHEVKKLLDYNVTTAPFGVPVLTSTNTVDVTTLPTYPGTRLTFNNFSPEVTVTYKPHNDMMFFASVKKGFKSGGFDSGYTAGAIRTNPARGQTFKPEKVKGGEIGLKSRFADRQFTFNATAYWYVYSDLQVTTYDTAARAFRTQNAAKARIRGIELESAYRPSSVPGLNFHATAAFNDTKFLEYLGDCYQGQTFALGCNLNFVPSLNQANPGVLPAQVNGLFGYYTLQDLSGFRLRKAPKYTATFGGYYEFPVGTGLMMSLSSDLSFSSGYNYGTAYQPYTYQKAFTTIDAMLRLFTQNKHWEFAVIGRNLTNKRNLINGIDRTGTGGPKGSTSPTCTTISQTGCIKLPDVIGTPAVPRTVALQLTWRY
jgi:iron complex outermembrane receptor protein